MSHAARDHGGRLDAALARWGGARAEWLDLSTGINPTPYPLPDLPPEVWTALPDETAQQRLAQAARRFWNVPPEAGVLAAPGASALIARLPALAQGRQVHIQTPTYNEHAAAFRAHGFNVTGNPDEAPARVLVHPNNPDGRLWQETDVAGDLTVIDESFCDVTPAQSLVHLSTEPGVVVLKSFGKFWGLAGLRLGFAIGAHAALDQLAEALGPWPVSGPALTIGAQALEDEGWANQTRQTLETGAARLDRAMAPHGSLVGGTSLFRLYDVGDAAAFQNRLARARIWSRTFPYSTGWVRLGLPASNRWAQLEAAL